MHSRTTLVALVAVVLFTVSRLPAGGQSGVCSGAGCPDSDFGTNGIVRLSSFGGAIGAIAIQNIGGVDHVVALNTSTGSWKLTRYHFTSDDKNVAVDTTFGTSGVVTKSVNSSTVTARSGMAVLPDNKLVVVGASQPTKRGSAASLVVVLYGANGQEEKSLTFAGFSSATAPRLQSDGKILLAIPLYTGAAGDSAVIRLTSAGDLDNTFGAGGIATIPNVGQARALAVQRVEIGAGVWEDNIVLCTSVYRPTEQRYVASLVRLDSNGTLDGSFIDGASALAAAMNPPGSPGFDDVAVDSAGRIVAALHGASRTANNELVYTALAARFTPQGVLDDGFGDLGVSALASPGAQFQNVLVDQNDRVLLVGLPMPTFWNTRGLVVWRLLENGVADPSFGTNGLTATIVTEDPMSSMWPGLDVGPGSCPHVSFLGGGTKFVVGGSAYVPNSKRVYTAVGAIGRFLY